MSREDSSPESSTAVEIPEDWDGADVEELAPGVYLAREVGSDGRVPPFFLPAGRRPILADVHYGRSAILRDRVEAIRYGYRESDVYTEFYALQLIDEPEWVQITEESEEHELGIVEHLDEWVEEGRLTPEEAEWADDQFD